LKARRIDRIIGTLHSTYLRSVQETLMQPAVQHSARARLVVTENDVLSAQSESRRASEELKIAERRVAQIEASEKSLSRKLVLNGWIRRVRRLCDDWTTRTGGLVILSVSPLMIVLVACNLLGLPARFWMIPLIPVLSLTVFMGTKLFQPDDKTLDLE